MQQTALVEEVPLEELVTEIGPLSRTVPLFKLGSHQHSDQLTNERRKETNLEKRKELRNTWFYAADSPNYTVEDSEAILYLGRGNVNPIFKNLEEATNQLLRKRNYVTSREELEAVKNDEGTLRIKLSDLELERHNEEFSYFEIDTAGYDKLNEAQRAFAERVYGQGEDFKHNMEMLNKEEIRKTRIYVLNPDYIKENAPEEGGLARASRLYGFGLDSGFGAGGRDVDVLRLGLRGVRNVAEGGVPKIADPIADAYQTILEAKPDQALKAMTTETATGLSGLVTRYLGNLQKQ